MQNNLLQFAEEISALGREVQSQLGEKDKRHLKKVVKLSNLTEFFGRGFIHFSLDPVTWMTGVLCLWVHHQLESGEIGHSALHGVWDSVPGVEKWHSSNFNWKSPVDEKSWQKEHNQLHHQFTNIVGRDPDLNYGALRMTKSTKWHPHHLFQLGQFFVSTPVFIWMVAMHASGLSDLIHPLNDDSYADILPDRKPKTVLKALKRTAKKMLPYFSKEFIFWPALAGPMALKVLAGNIAADVLRSAYMCATIYAGHFGDDLHYSEKDFKAEGRAGWYKTQVEGAHNYSVSPFLSLMCGGLDYQIEHHLFPKLPPNRLREIAPRVEEICKRYNVLYNKRSWAGNLKLAFQRLAKMSLPETLAIS